MKVVHRIISIAIITTPINKLVKTVNKYRYNIAAGFTQKHKYYLKKLNYS